MRVAQANWQCYASRGRAWPTFTAVAMSLATMIYGQFGRPRGLLGALAGTIMARRPSNRARSEWAVSLLAIEPTDQVLEIGSGPGIALALASEGAPLGRVVGIDHSDLMCRWARERNAEAVRAGKVEVRCAGLEALDDFPAAFDKAFSVNVAQFWEDPAGALKLLASALKPGGLLVTVHQPRHAGETTADALAFAERFTREKRLAGFTDIDVQRLPLKPVEAVAILARAGAR